MRDALLKPCWKKHRNAAAISAKGRFERNLRKPLREALRLQCWKRPWSCAKHAKRFRAKALKSATRRNAKAMLGKTQCWPRCWKNFTAKDKECDLQQTPPALAVDSKVTVKKAEKENCS